MNVEACKLLSLKLRLFNFPYTTPVLRDGILPVYSRSKFKVQSSYKHCPSGMAYTQAKHTQNITVRNQFRISERVNLERGVTSYFPGDRDKESTHSPFSPCTNRVGCVRCWGNFAETNRLALNGLKLWSPLTRVSSV